MLAENDMEKQDKQSRAKETGCGVEGESQGAPGKHGPGTGQSEKPVVCPWAARHLGLEQREGQVTQ